MCLFHILNSRSIKKCFVSVQKLIGSLQRQLEEEKRRVQAAEKKLKMADVPLSGIKDDTRLRQHEKTILIQEVCTRANKETK